MKKTVKSLCDIIENNRTFISNQREQDLTALVNYQPKAVVLCCGYPLRFMEHSSEKIYIVANYGGILKGNEASLDHGIKDLAIPMLIIIGHEDCSAVKSALKGEGNTEFTKELFNNIMPCFAQGKSRKIRDNIMKHIDYQVSQGLERYRDLVKAEKLAIVGVFCDNTGKFSICNYNGLRGLPNLAQALPDVDPSLFLE
ncbi:MAG: carbonic anhydrase [Clostridiales bacterium]